MAGIGSVHGLSPLFYRALAEFLLEQKVHALVMVISTGLKIGRQLPFRIYILSVSSTNLAWDFMPCCKYANALKELSSEHG